MADSKRIWTLIPAAGRSERFLAAGHELPKPLLRVRHAGRTDTMIGHVLRELHYDHAPIVACLTPYVRQFRNAVAHQCNVIGVDETVGQAHTVLQALERCGARPDDGVVTVDCDVVLPHQVSYHVVYRLRNDEDNVVFAVTDRAGPDTSKIDNLIEPTRVKEREPAWRWSVMGQRGVRRAVDLETGLREAMNREIGQPSLSDALQHVPVPWCAVLATQFMDWGTPESLAASGAELV